MNRSILHIALPSIVTNITVPLLGIVDLAIVGHLTLNATDGQVIPTTAAIIGAVSVGTLIFNMVYWLFNFLRMGSSGLTAQAYGRGDHKAQLRILRMALTVALSCGAAIIALQRPIEWIAHLIIAPSAEVWQLAIAYFRIRIWAAPAVLALFAINGWLIGMQNSRYPLYIAVGQNLVNIGMSCLFVFWLHQGIEGVALGTVVAQYAALLTALWLSSRQSQKAATQLSTQLSTISVHNANINTSQQPDVDKSTPNPESYQQSGVHTEWKTFFIVNRDIFLRMVCLIAVTTAFTSYSARMGDAILAVNTLLLQLFTLFSYFSDGFALAGEALVGKAIGRRQSPQALVHRLFLWGWGVAAGFTLLYLLAAPWMLRLFTNDPHVLQSALPYLPWTCAIPLCGIAAFLWDGIFVGATRTRAMFHSLLIAALLFFSLYELLSSFCPDASLRNHLLWLCFLLYLTVRGLVLWRSWSKLKRKRSEPIRIKPF